ncbi:unnamed protein product [Diamesa serratosioi]
MFAKNLKNIKLITFDCTNTLLYFKNPPEKQYLITAAENGFHKEDFNPDLMKKSFRKYFKDLNKEYPNFGTSTIGYMKWWEKLVFNVFISSTSVDLDQVKLKNIASILINIYKTKECWEKFEKIDDLLMEMKKSGKIIGVISNFDPRLKELLNDMDLKSFDFIITSYESKVEKPNPKIFELARNEMQKIANEEILPHECLHIGNELVKDYQGARNIGWKSVLINSDCHVNSQFKDIKEFYTLLEKGPIAL